MEKPDQFSGKDYFEIKRHLTDVKINLESRCVSRKQCFAYTILLFILAGVFEIGGGYLIWLWLREGRGLTFAFLGAIVLFLYGIVPTFQPANFHRIYATYGGIFVIMSILMGLGIRQDPTGYVRSHRRRDNSYRSLDYILLAKEG